MVPITELRDMEMPARYVAADMLLEITLSAISVFLGMPCNHKHLDKVTIQFIEKGRVLNQMNRMSYLHHLVHPNPFLVIFKSYGS